MKTESLNLITLIIRSVRERTEQLCKKLMIDQGVKEENIFVVNEVPFSAAMKKSFEIGINENKKWTFCIDADVLLGSGSIEKMIEYAEKQNENVCEIQGFVMDKFFGGPRQAGNHLYRTSLLEKVIECIPDEGVDIRPERYTLGRMKLKGYDWKIVPCIVGIHDAEQFNFDIYRKAFVYAIKHLDRAELLITNWREQYEHDPDFKVALKGFSDSINNTKSAFINCELPLYKEKFNESGFGEKQTLEMSGWTPEFIGQKINNWNYSDLYLAYFPGRDGLDNKRTASLKKVKRSIERRGYIRTSMLIVSELLSGIGKRLRPN